MAEQEIKAGDVVQLKSGSPLLTAGEATRSGLVQVSWMVDGEAREAFFHPVMLRHASAAISEPPRNPIS